MSEQSLTALLKYLSEESFSKCSNKDGKCSACKRFKNTCDGLFRKYLYEDCRKITESIKKVQQSKCYQLCTNISHYHTLAVDQLINMEGDSYRVVQPLLKKEGQVYDEMDIDFLKVFINKVFENRYSKADVFQVQWIFVGQNDSGNIAINNYKYLVDELGKKNDKIRRAFHFKVISKKSYIRIKQQNSVINKTEINDYYKGDNPSLGIFGEGFVFVDAVEAKDQHGTMYANPEDIPNVVDFYNLLWESSDAREVTFSELADNCQG